MTESAEALRGILGEITKLATDPVTPDLVTERVGDALYRYFA